MSNIKCTSSIADISDTTSTVNEEYVSAITCITNEDDTPDKIFRACENDMSDIDDMALTYDTEMVSKVLGVQSSTIRKYCALMQKFGHEFNKNSVGHRVFYAKDISIIKEIVELKNSSSLTLTEAVRTILNLDTADITDIESMSNASYERLLKEFAEFKNQQMDFNKKLLEQLEKQEDYIKIALMNAILN